MSMILFESQDAVIILAPLKHLNIFVLKDTQWSQYLSEIEG